MSLSRTEGVHRKRIWIKESLLWDRRVHPKYISLVKEMAAGTLRNWWSIGKLITVEHKTLRKCVGFVQLTN